jgi:hypothetical protein
MEFLEMLKSKDKFERAEGYCIVFLIAGALMLSSGIGLTIISPEGIPAILAMLGALMTFLSTAGLIFTWFFKEMVGE